jgi:hypothetical protein
MYSMQALVILATLAVEVNKIEENGCQPLKDCELALVLVNVQLLAQEPRQ